MTSTRELYAFLTFTSMMMVYHCKAGKLTYYLPFSRIILFSFYKGLINTAGMYTSIKYALTTQM